MDLHRLTAPPRWPQVTSQRGQEGSKRALRTSRGAQETPKGAQEGAKRVQERSKMAQVGSKVGPEMRKVAKVKLLKNHWFLLCFGPPGRPKMTPREPQMAHLDPRGRQERPKGTSRRPRGLVRRLVRLVSDLSKGPGDLSDVLRWSRVTALRQKTNKVRGSFLSNCPEIRSPLLTCLQSPNLFHLKTPTKCTTNENKINRKCT